MSPRQGLQASYVPSPEVFLSDILVLPTSVYAEYYHLIMFSSNLPENGLRIV